MVDKLEETLRDFEDAFYGGSLKQMREDGVEVVTTKWLRRRLQNLIAEERKKTVEEFVEENRGFSYWSNLKASAKRYLTQKEEE